jgi:predicted RNA binding protein YcfA (HicA-like mRNA interferase family)
MPPKVRDILARLRAEGWIQVRQRGSHRILKHPEHPTVVTVAGHPNEEPARGTWQSIQKQAGWLDKE